MNEMGALGILGATIKGSVLRIPSLSASIHTSILHPVTSLTPPSSPLQVMAVLVPPLWHMASSREKWRGIQHAQTSDTLLFFRDVSFIINSAG